MPALRTANREKNNRRGKISLGAAAFVGISPRDTFPASGEFLSFCAAAEEREKLHLFLILRRRCIAINFCIVGWRANGASRILTIAVVLSSLRQIVTEAR